MRFSHDFLLSETGDFRQIGDQRQFAYKGINWVFGYRDSQWRLLSFSPVEARLLTEQELSYLHVIWDNDYSAPVLSAYEVSAEVYQIFKEEGARCQKCNGRYYIG